MKFMLNLIPGRSVTLLLCFAFGLLPLGGQAQIKPMIKKGTTRAVVIGVSDYADPHVPDLEFADADARAIVEYLQSKAGGSIPPSQIKLLVNADATQGKMAAALTWLLNESKEGDKAVIFFSGHGDMETETLMSYGFLLTHEAPAANYFGGGVYSVDYLKAIVETMSNNKVDVTLITDACHAGKLAGSLIGGTQATAKKLSEQFRNEVKFMSCQPNQFSLEGRDWGGGHGVFTYFLIEGLSGFADVDNDLKVSLLEIQRFLQDSVSAAAAKKSKKQFPKVDGGDLDMAISTVDKATKEALLEKRKKTSPAVANQEIAARDPKSGATSEDTLTLARYRQFQEAMASKHLLYPEKGSAWTLYNQIRNKPAVAEYTQEMRLDLAASLQDEAQQAITAYMNADPRELHRRWSRDTVYEHFPEYLAKSAELFGKDNVMYPELKAREMYFKGVNLRLKAEAEKNNTLFTDATTIQEKVLELNPNAAYAFNELGLLARRRGDYETSIIWFEKALDISPTWVMALTNICGSFTVTKQFEKAKINCLNAVEYNDAFAPAHYNLGVAYQRMNENDNAIASFKKAISVDPDYAMPYFKLGNAYYFNKNYDLAKEAWLQCTQKDPGYANAFQNLGELAKDQGNPEAAETWFLKAVEADPDYFDAFYSIALLSAQQNNPDKALLYLEKAFKKGYKDLGQLEAETALATVRESPAYKTMVKKYFP